MPKKFHPHGDKFVIGIAGLQVYMGCYVGADVAIKRLAVDPACCRPAEALSLFVREADLQRRLSAHPNVVRMPTARYL